MKCKNCKFLEFRIKQLEEIITFHEKVKSKGLKQLRKRMIKTTKALKKLI